MIEVPRRALATGEFLFHHGELRRRAFRVARGALCHYMQWHNGRHEVIEFAFPGDIIGFGHMDRHVSTAQAMVDTEVVPLTDTAFDDALARDAGLAHRLASAADREFDYVKEQAVAARPRSAVARVAAFVLATAALSLREGGEAVAAGVADTDSLAATLDLGRDELLAALAKLADERLVALEGESVRVIDAAGLDAVAS